MALEFYVSHLDISPYERATPRLTSNSFFYLCTSVLTRALSEAYQGPSSAPFLRAQRSGKLWVHCYNVT